MLREGNEVRAVHDRHIEGVFSKATWFSVLASAGYRVETAERVVEPGKVDEIFLCFRA